jgi:SPASM domain peptide maturase of grasp-with-spasm system
MSKGDQKILEEYAQFILENDLGFMVKKEEIDQYPPLSTEWDSSEMITNVIVDIKDNHIFLNNVISQLMQLKTSFVQLRFFNTLNIDTLTYIIEQTSRSRIKGIEVYLPHHESITTKKLNKIFVDNERLRQVIIYNCSTTKTTPISETNAYIYQTTQNTISEKSCGIIHPNYFSTNLALYTESLAHNTCLNRKISIDADGNIKNCPSMQESFGNIKDTTLQEAINKPNFKKYWNITKDEITKCKDCEFRHVCTDCRAYLENPDDIYSAPLKCGYNPYTCEWEEWSTNPLKQQAIEHYGMREILATPKS